MLSSGDHGLSWSPFLASYLPIFTVTEPRKEYKTGIHAAPFSHQERNATDFPGEPGKLPSPGLCVYSTDSAPPSLLSSSAPSWRRPEVGQGDMEGTFFFFRQLSSHRLVFKAVCPLIPLALVLDPESILLVPGHLRNSPSQTEVAQPRGRGCRVREGSAPQPKAYNHPVTFLVHTPWTCGKSQGGYSLRINRVGMKRLGCSEAL